MPSPVKVMLVNSQVPYLCRCGSGDDCPNKFNGYRKCSKCGRAFKVVLRDENDFVPPCPMDASWRISGMCGGVLGVESNEAEYAMGATKP